MMPPEAEAVMRQLDVNTGAAEERQAVIAALRDMRAAWQRHDDNEIVATRIALLDELVTFFEKRAHRSPILHLMLKNDGVMKGLAFEEGRERGRAEAETCRSTIPGTVIACGETFNPQLGLAGRQFCSEVCRLRAVVEDIKKQRDHWKAHALKLLGEEEPTGG